MDYELCKKLKDAGFPQGDEYSVGEYMYGKTPDTRVKVPTLEELIDACGEELECLSRMCDADTNKSIGWITNPDDMSDKIIYETPTEAVAKLYLALYNKDNDKSNKKTKFK